MNFCGVVSIDLFLCRSSFIGQYQKRQIYMQHSRALLILPLVELIRINRFLVTYTLIVLISSSKPFSLMMNVVISN